MWGSRFFSEDGGKVTEVFSDLALCHGKINSIFSVEITEWMFYNLDNYEIHLKRRDRSGVFKQFFDVSCKVHLLFDSGNLRYFCRQETA